MDGGYGVYGGQPLHLWWYLGSVTALHIPARAVMPISMLHEPHPIYDSSVASSQGCSHLALREPA